MRCCQSQSIWTLDIVLIMEASCRESHAEETLFAAYNFDRGFQLMIQNNCRLTMY